MKEPKSKLFKYPLISLLIALIVISASAAFYFYKQYQNSQVLVNNPEAVAQEEVKELTEKLSGLIELPQDEEPTLATVLAKEKLTDQPFFAKAENGDKVFIYAKALKAILYRPATNKIIEMAPITMQPEASVKPARKAAEPEPEASPEETTE